MKKRSEADSKYTWKLEDMVAEDSQWEQMFKEASGEISEYASYKGRLAGSADTLYACLLFDDKLSQKIERLYVYARMRSDEDTTVQRYQDMFSRAQTLSYRAAENSSFLVPEILSMDRELLEQYMAADNGIGHFKRALEIILARRDHTLSGEMEELQAQSYDATQGASQIFTMFNNADVKFPVITGESGEGIQITHGNYISLMENQDRRIRKDAFEGLYSVYEQFSNTLAAAFSSNVKQAVFYAKAKKYASSREYYLADNEVPELVYDNLVKAVRENIVKLHEYTRVRKDVLGVDELHMYDLYVPMVAAADRRYTYEEAKSIVLEGLAPLGEEYLSLLKQGFDSRWIDVYENEGKRSGAYSWGTYGSHPYVLLNFHGTLNDVFTLAHEMGHSLHSWYSDHAQPPAYAGYTIFVAEVASTCNEVILFQHMIRQAETREEKESLIFQLLDRFRSVMFRQTMFAEFEWETHKMCRDGIPLTADALCSLYHGLNEKYFGPDMCVDPEIDVEWARIPHFYYTFYVYQYATAFAAAVTIGQRIFDGDKNALEGYFNFLKGGSSMKPTELLKLCGLDMEGPGVVNAALDVFESLLGSLE